MRCDIIIPVWNELETTRKCVDSLVKNTGYPFKLIVVDNASDRETAFYLAALKTRADISADLIRNNENFGFAKAVNQGIAASDAPYVCIMNNDTIVSAGWLEEMMNVMAAHSEIGILNPSSNTSGQGGPEKGSDPFSGPFCPDVLLDGFRMPITGCAAITFIISSSQPEAVIVSLFIMHR